MEDLVVYEASRALARTNGCNYAIQCGGNQLDLKRGVDFDNPINKKTGKKTFDKPILQKPGAEKISFAFGLLQQYSMSVTGVIYNKATPSLPHLLEHGHANRGGGRTPGRPHIAPAEEQIVKEYEEEVKSKL